MRFFSRAAVTVASFLCLLGAATISVPSFASETSAAPAGSATAMLAAVTGPLLAVDVHTLEQRAPDFSTPQTTQAPVAGSPEAQAAVATTPDATTIAPQDLADLVAAHADEAIADDESNCLATSVYYESKGEPLNGQLAVAQTIINRTHSGRFPASVCGVVRQHGQFSFLRGGELPSPPKASDAWHKAVAIAKIAQQGLWKQIAPAALYFHARRVSPGWGKIRVASLGNHIFFR
jgi:spore germination cell wall hydrolase CwlJ-like protein